MLSNADDIKNTIKQLKRIENDENDFQIEFSISKAHEMIMNYCNIPFDEELPNTLNLTLTNMAMDILDAEHLLDSASGDIASVKRGDVTVSYDNSSSNSFFVNSAFMQYETILQTHRRLF